MSKNECATVNCEDNSHKDGWAYCGKGNCSSCGGGCGSDTCRKCNNALKSKERAFRTGWAVVKGFEPEDDTCIRCGGQKTPERYGADGPPNGNCSCNE